MSSNENGRESADIMPRTLVTIIAVAALLMSILTLRSYDLYIQFNSVVTVFLNAFGIPFNTDIILLIVVLIIILIGILSPKRLNKMVRKGWWMLVPAVLYYSQIDWLYISGLPVNFTVFKNYLPEVYILCNGILLISASMVIRSHQHMTAVRKGLEERGASTSDLNIAMRKNYHFLLMLVGISAGTTALIAGAVTVLSPILEGFLGQYSYAYLGIGVITAVLIIVIFGLYTWYGGNLQAKSERS